MSCITKLCGKYTSSFGLGSIFCFNKNFSVVTNKMPKWEEEKARFLSMSIDEKRKLYQSERITTIQKILPWDEYLVKNNVTPYQLEDKSPIKPPKLNDFLNEKLAKKVSVWQGDITTLEIDAIVNAANSSLRGGGGVDGAIHRAAGSLLLQECISLNGCPTGAAKITGGYLLPARYVIHTVGPQGEQPQALQNCYTNSLALAVESEIKTIGFPSISTGIYGYPMENATSVALNSVRQVLEKDPNAFERIIFVVFSNDDLNTYQQLMQIFFPLKTDDE